MIWFKEYSIADINALNKDTMASHLGIVFNAVGENYLRADMPVDNYTVQPARLLHGGASVTLAETIGSVGAYMTVDPRKYQCVGLEINANHIRSKKSGKVTGTGKPLHVGKTTQVWEIKITDEADKLICVSRLTIAVLNK